MMVLTGFYISSKKTTGVKQLLHFFENEMGVNVKIEELLHNGGNGAKIHHYHV